jgi:hypothetical protein
MPTFEQIQEKDTIALDDLEREMVRQILGIVGKAGTATYVESEIRMAALTGVQNQIIRAIIDDYSDISFDTTYVAGGSKGTNYNPQRDKEYIANELRRMLYPSAIHETTSITEIEETLSAFGTIQFVPIEYKIGTEGELT